jgi:DNA-binding transcriptional ArsR family regulator
MDGTDTSAVGVIGGAARAAAMLHPLRLRILAALREPGSATTLATALGLPRQKVNYHLRALEKHDLVDLVEERRRGNCTERVLRARARSFVLSPRAVGALAADPAEIEDRFSSAYLTALLGRALEDVGDLRERADRAGKRLATFSLQTEVRFASPEARAAFTGELAGQVARLAAKYHDESADGGRRFRFLLGAWPARAAKRGSTPTRT